MNEIKKLHDFYKSGRRHDEMFRRFYYGGRVQTFESGVLPGLWKLYDVNSMYPSAMKYKKHPINGCFEVTDRLPKSFDMPFFLTFRGRNINALPSVAEDGGLIFNKEHGIFNAVSHEIEIALDHGLIEIDEILECIVSTEAITFDSFVDKFYAEKAACKQAKDKIGELFAKLLLNSGYGRFGINPDNFADWIIHRDFGNEEELEAGGYSIAADYEDIELWSRPTDVKDEQFCDVAVAASITSAARSILLAGLQNAVRPIYCDTDSIICSDFSGDIDKSRLGAWDLEKSAEMAAIAGKKMYCLYAEADTEIFSKNTKSNVTLLCSKCKAAFINPREHADHQSTCNVKLSSKGGSLNLCEIIEIAKGGTIAFKNDAPTFSLKRKPTFVSRTFTQTINSLDPSNEPDTLNRPDQDDLDLVADEADFSF